MKYFNNFTCLQDVKDQFSSVDSDYKKLNDVELKEEEVVLASYGGESYTGDAVVFLVRDGKLYEVHGSHCSCNGLEGQWNLEETSLEALEHRFDNGNLEYFISEHGEEFLDAIRRVILNEVFEREVLLRE